MGPVGAWRPDGGTPLMERPTHEMLLGLGGLLAIFLGPLFFVLEIAFRGFGLGGVTAVVVNVVFGFLLLASVGVLRRSLLSGLVLAFVCSLVLFLGGIAGAIGGLFGLVGSGLIFLANYEKLLR